MVVERLREVCMQIDTDISDFMIGKEQFDEELEEYDEDDVEPKCPSVEKLRKLKEGMETWVEMLDRSMDNLDEEINKYERKLILKSLEK